MRVKIQFAILSATILLGASRLLGAPVVTSFDPTFASATDPGYINIHGSGFSPGTLVVKFNGVTATASATAPDLIQAQVPGGAPLGSGPIYVSVAGQATWSSDDFTVIGAGPYISDFTPSVGNSGTTVTINGAHFSNPTSVKFTGANASNVSPISPTQLTVNAPGGVKTGPITASNGLGGYTTVTNFHVPPTINGFSPSGGRVGTNVIISGSSFVDATAVRFGALDATSFNVLSNGAIQAVVPANATNGLIRVIAPAGSAFSGSNFLILPTISNFSPASGTEGTSVTVFGANFNAGTPIVKFNGTNAASVSGVTFNQLTAVVPNGATTGPITVTTTNGTATSATNFFLPPFINLITPNNSGPGTLVQISGQNFVGATAVNFSGAAAAAFWVSNNTTIGALVPFGVTTGPISVTTPGGTANSSVRFYVAPSISVFFPTHGLPGTNVTITGQNFFDASVVSFNGTNAAFTVLNNTTISATVPNDAQTGPITVVAPAGTNTTAENFTLDYTADMAVTITDSPDPVTTGSNLIYTIIVQNNGPFPARGATLSNTLPASVYLKSATLTAGNLNTNGNPITADLGQMALGSSIVLTLNVVPQLDGRITNIVSVASLYTDPTPTNNITKAETLVQPAALLSIQIVNTNRVRVAWPAALTNYTLQFKPLFASTNFWSNVLTAPLTVESETSVTETNTDAMKFYRLKR